MRVMMSAAGSPVAPGIIRHLQSLGHYVIGHDCCDLGYGANVCDRFFRSPPARDGEDFSAWLWSLRDCFDVYLPFIDEELRYVIQPNPTSDLETTRIFTSKRKQLTAMVEADLPVPLRMFDGVPAIAKPDHGRGGKGVMKITNSDICRRLSTSSEYLVTRFIDGDEYTIDVLTGMDGAFLFAVPRLRIQANGVSVIGKIVMDAKIIELARQVVSKFDFRGPINIQVIRERDTGKLYIIELNPRLSGSCMFTVMAGFDILDATIKLWEGKPFVPPAKIEDGLIVRRHYVEERL